MVGVGPRPIGLWARGDAYLGDMHRSTRVIP